MCFVQLDIHGFKHFKTTWCDIRILQGAVQNKVSQELSRSAKMLSNPNKHLRYILLIVYADTSFIADLPQTLSPKLKLLQIIFPACLVNVYLDLDHVKGIIGWYRVQKYHHAMAVWLLFFLKVSVSSQYHVFFVRVRVRSYASNEFCRSAIE